MARRIRGFTQKQVADRAALAPAYIARIEAGDRNPSRDTLVSLCFALGFEPEFFERPVLHEVHEDDVHWRSLKSTTKRTRLSVMFRTALLLELVEFLEGVGAVPDADIPTFEATTEREIEAAAGSLREAWGIPRDAPILNLTRLLESKGIIVTRFSGVDRTVDALSTRAGRPVVILGDGKSSTSRARMSMAHELAHFVLHPDVNTGSCDIERQADQFAAAFLVPSRALLFSYPCAPQLSWEAVFEQKARWRVSAAALVRRLFRTRSIGPRERKAAEITIRSRGWHLGEPHEPPKEHPAFLQAAVDRLWKSRRMGGDEIAAAIGLRLSDLRSIVSHVKFRESNGTGRVLRLPPRPDA